MTGSHEIVIRLGRPFDIQTGDGTFRDKFRDDVSEITIPFHGGRESAEAALREIEVFVRPVHDAGGEDYRPVVAGEVVETEADAQFAADLASAVSAQRERERMRELEGNAGA